MKRLAITWFAAALLGGWLPADGELVEQIELVSKQLRREPGSSELFLRRADLLRRWGRMDAALGDLHQASRLEGDPLGIAATRARVLRDSGQRHRALAAFGRCLRMDPKHAGLRTERAHLLVDLGRQRSAAREFERATGYTRTPTPGLFLASSTAWKDAGDLDQALRTLETGIARLGNLVSLALPAFQIEVELGATDAALARIDGIAANIPRLDGWHLHRARALGAAERGKEARAAYTRALSTLNALPNRRRTTRAAARMVEEAQAGLAEWQ